MLAKPQVQRTFVLVSGLCFAGSMVMGLVPLYMGQSQPTSEQSEAAIAQSEQEQLLQEERGFAIVVQREPENQTALEGLANARLALKDYTGAIAPLEKLVSLYPDRADYQTSLTEARQQSKP